MNLRAGEVWKVNDYWNLHVLIRNVGERPLQTVISMHGAFGIFP